MPISVKELMSKPAVTIDYKNSAKTAGTKMREHRKGFLVVTKDGRPIGTVSDSDLIEKIVAKGKLSSQIVVEKLMSKPIVYAEPDDDVNDVVGKMKKNNIHRLPVIKHGKVVGVISLTDIAKSSPEMSYLLEYRNKMKRKEFSLKERITSGICGDCGNFSDHLKETSSGEWMCEPCRDELESEY